jgi:flagellar basal-body rod protein FlgG
MVRGLYTAWTGMANEQKRLDIISNNLANSATVGFKKEGVTNQSFDDMLSIKIRDKSENAGNRVIGSMTLGVKLGEVYTDYNQGSLRETGNTFDLALEGDGFFQIAVTDANGNESFCYTRAAQLVMDREGFVVDVNGNHLTSESGNLQVPTDAGQIVIDVDGSVYADGSLVDKVVVKDFEDYDYMKKYGDTMYTAEEGAVEKETSSLVRQGFTEQSNVNVVSEMVNMIAITRAYEANQKVIQSIDGTLDLAANSIGKL